MLWRKGGLYCGSLTLLVFVSLPLALSDHAVPIMYCMSFPCGQSWHSKPAVCPDLSWIKSVYDNKPAASKLQNGTLIMSAVCLPVRPPVCVAIGQWLRGSHSDILADTPAVPPCAGAVCHSW